MYVCLETDKYECLYHCLSEACMSYHVFVYVCMNACVYAYCRSRKTANLKIVEVSNSKIVHVSRKMWGICIYVCMFVDRQIWVSFSLSVWSMCEFPLFVYICMNACVYAYMYVWMHAYIYAVCMYIALYVDRCINVHAFMYGLMDIARHAHVCMHVFMEICMLCVVIITKIHIYVCTCAVG